MVTDDLLDNLLAKDGSESKLGVNDRVVISVFTVLVDATVEFDIVLLSDLVEALLLVLAEVLLDVLLECLGISAMRLRVATGVCSPS